MAKKKSDKTECSDLITKIIILITAIINLIAALLKMGD